MSVLSAQSLALALQFVAGLDSEIAGGVAPPFAGGDSEPTILATLVPSAGISDPTPRGVHYSFIYSPRTLFRRSDTFDSNRPALLHRLLLEYRPILEDRTEGGFVADLAAGEVDYTAVSQIFGEAQTVTPTDPFIDVFTGNLQPFIDHKLTSRWSLHFALPVSYQTPLGQQQDAIGSFSETRTIGLRQTTNHVLTRRDLLFVTMSSTLASFESADQLSNSVLFGWGHDLTPHTGTNLAAGFGRIDDLGRESTDPPSNVEETTYFGMAVAGVQHSRPTRSFTAQASLDARVDPLAQAIRPQASLTLSALETLSRTSSLNAQLGGYSAVASEPLEFDPTEMGANASVSLQILLAEPLTLRCGVRGAIRGPHPAQRFELREPEALAFMGLSWSLPSR